MHMVLVIALADFSGSANGYSHARYLAGNVYELLPETAASWSRSGRVRLLTDDELIALDQAIEDEVAAHQAKAEAAHQAKAEADAEATASSVLASRPARPVLALVESPPFDMAAAVKPDEIAAALIAEATPPPPLEPAPPAEVVTLKPRKRKGK